MWQRGSFPESRGTDECIGEVCTDFQTRCHARKGWSGRARPSERRSCAEEEASFAGPWAPPAGHTGKSLPALWTVGEGCGVPDEVPAGRAAFGSVGEPAWRGRHDARCARSRWGEDGWTRRGGAQTGVAQALLTGWTREASERLGGSEVRSRDSDVEGHSRGECAGTEEGGLVASLAGGCPLPHSGLLLWLEPGLPLWCVSLVPGCGWWQL